MVTLEKVTKLTKQFFIQVLLGFTHSLAFSLPNRMSSSQQREFHKTLLSLMWGGKWFCYPLTGTEYEQEQYLKQHGVYDEEQILLLRSSFMTVRQTVVELGRGDKWLWRRHKGKQIPELLMLVKKMYKL